MLVDGSSSEVPSSFVDIQCSLMEIPNSCTISLNPLVVSRLSLIAERHDARQSERKGEIGSSMECDERNCLRRSCRWSSLKTWLFCFLGDGGDERFDS